jgi:release factor glutamine methyltransferase
MNSGNTTVMQIRQSFLAGLKELYEKDEINNITYILFEEFLGWPRTKLYLEAVAAIEPLQARMFSDALLRLADGCPVQYITSKADFNGLSISVNPSVLIPRQETAELAFFIALELKTLDLDGFSAIDVCTGSGCIAIYLKKQFPGISMHAIDISEDALSTAQANAAENGTSIDFHITDILDTHGQPANHKFNLVVSNPPYVTLKEKQAMKINVTAYEPCLALFVPDEDPLLFYRKISLYSKTHLTEGGLLFFEINEAFGNEIKELLISRGFSNVVVRKDFGGKDRFIRAEFRNRS